MYLLAKPSKFTSGAALAVARSNVLILGDCKAFQNGVGYVPHNVATVRVVSTFPRGIGNDTRVNLPANAHYSLYG